MKKVAFFCLLTLILTVFAAGCGQQPQDDTVIKIGVNLELTGGIASYGNATLNGLKLAVDEQNAKGGINGKKIELVVRDNKSDPAESTNSATDLAQKGVCAIIGPDASSNVISELQVSQDNKIPVIAPAATAEAITVDPATKKVRPYAFRACFIDSFQGTVLTEFVKQTMPQVKTAVLYVDGSSDYSKGIAAVIKSSFIKNGGKILATEQYLQKDNDFRSTLTRIKGYKPDIIFAPGYAEELGKIVAQSRDLGITCPFIGGDAWDNPLLVQQAGAKNVENCYFSAHYSNQDPDPAIQKFVSDYKAAYKNEDPNYAAVLGYDAALLLFNAIEKAGSADPQAITAALAATKDLQLTTGKFSFDTNHNPVKGAVVLGFKDGKQVMKDKIQP